jgi:hypothetical protein
LADAQAAHPYRQVPALARSLVVPQGATSTLPKGALPDSCIEVKRSPLAVRRKLGALLHEEAAIRTSSLPSSAEEYILVRPVQKPEVVESASTCASDERNSLQDSSIRRRQRQGTAPVSPIVSRQRRSRRLSSSI